MTKTVKTTKFDGFEVGVWVDKEGKSRYSLEARTFKEDKTYPVWAKYETARDVVGPSRPVKVILGLSKADALANLRMAIQIVEDGGDNESPF